MKLDASEISRHLPLYLTDHKKIELADALDAFRRHGEGEYYTPSPHKGYLQGDGWSGFKVVEIETLQEKKIKGVILNNTCDISPENPRAIPHRVMFAPMVKVENYKKRLEAAGVQAQGIESTLRGIRKQGVTNLFYLPVGPGVETESIVILDDVKSLRAEYFIETQGSEKFFTLSDFGFYLFLFKISIHFCRLHENYQR